MMSAQRLFHVEGVRLDVHLTPGSGGPVVLLIHGFPDSRHLWDGVIPALETAGHRVLAPSLPGFGDSDRPLELAAYSLPSLARCMLGLLDLLGIAKALVVGHDWGASLAWYLAMKAPQRVERLVALSVGHAGALFAGGGLRQRQASWYMLWFLSQGAEEALMANDWALMQELFLVDSPTLQAYQRELSRPGALSAALGLYRANVRPASFGATSFPSFPLLALPVMGVWGTGDPALTEAQMRESRRYVAPGMWHYEQLDAGHWIPRDSPKELAALLLDFFAAPATQQPSAKL